MQNSLMCITAFCLSIKCTQTKKKNTGQVFYAIHIFQSIFATILRNLYIPPHICGYPTQSIYSSTYLQLFCAICILHHIVFAYSTQSISSTIYLQLFYAAVRDSAVAGSPVASSPVGSCTGCLLHGQATKRAPVCSETTISARDPAPRQAGIVFAADRCSFAKFRSPFRSGKASFSLQTGDRRRNSEANGCRRRAKVAKRCGGVNWGPRAGVPLGTGPGT